MLRLLGFVAGVLLIAGAVAIVLRQRDVLEQAVNAIQARQPASLFISIALLCATVLANLVMSGLVFSALMRRYGRVGVFEMQALVALASLLNYLPLRPGLLGRIAYHKAHNEIAVRDSVKVTLQAAGISAVVAAYLALAIIVSAQLAIHLWVLALLPVAALACAMFCFGNRSRFWSIAGGLRYLELFVIAARYHIAFDLIGSPVTVTSALALACISMIATMVPLLSNGLGLREWAIGAAAPLLAGYELAIGVTADLLIRAAEIVVVLIAGLVGLGWLARRSRKLLVEDPSRRAA